jgi:hypothetical protein
MRSWVAKTRLVTIDPGTRVSRASSCLMECTGTAVTVSGTPCEARSSRGFARMPRVHRGGSVVPRPRALPTFQHAAAGHARMWTQDGDLSYA